MRKYKINGTYSSNLLVRFEDVELEPDGKQLVGIEPRVISTTHIGGLHIGAYTIGNNVTTDVDVTVTINIKSTASDSVNSNYDIVIPSGYVGALRIITWEDLRGINDVSRDFVAVITQISPASSDEKEYINSGLDVIFSKEIRYYYRTETTPNLFDPNTDYYLFIYEPIADIVTPDNLEPIDKNLLTNNSFTYYYTKELGIRYCNNIVGGMSYTRADAFDFGYRFTIMIWNGSGWTHNGLFSLRPYDYEEIIGRQELIFRPFVDSQDEEGLDFGYKLEDDSILPDVDFTIKYNLVTKPPSSTLDIIINTITKTYKNGKFLDFEHINWNEFRNFDNAKGIRVYIEEITPLTSTTQVFTIGDHLPIKKQTSSTVVRFNSITKPMYFFDRYYAPINPPSVPLSQCVSNTVGKVEGNDLVVNYTEGTNFTVNSDVVGTNPFNVTVSKDQSLALLIYYYDSLNGWYTPQTGGGNSQVPIIIKDLEDTIYDWREITP